MNPGTEHRRLAAIMFTDMVGYSALAQRNDKLALELLEEHRRLLREILPRFNGAEIKTIGDAFLVEFNSALEAAQCAIEIQRALAKRNADLTADKKIELKIGIHIGDVVHRGGDVYGDGVNIASRIESLAGAGGICVSMDVERQVRNALEARFEKLAPAELKNISAPMELFRIVLPWESGGRIGVGQSASLPASRPTLHPRLRALLVFCVVIGGGCALWLFHPFGKTAKPSATQAISPPAPVSAAAAPAISDKSIAVLPFANMSEDTNNAFFAEGVHEDILTTLASVRDLHVVSRTSVEQYRATTKPMRQIAQELGVAYVLEGSVRRAGNKVRVTGQLIRASTDEHVWAKSYDRDLTDIFAIQSALATEIADSLQAVLSPQEKSLIERRPTANLAAYDLYLKARAVLKGMRTDMGRAQAEQLVSEAVKQDPNFAAAWGLLALAHLTAVFSEEDHSPERLDKAKVAIDTAVRLAPDDPEVVEMQGSYYYYGYRDYAHAAEQYQRLLVLRPNSADAYAQLGYMLRRQGHWTEALANLHHALELDPRNVNGLNELISLLNALRRYDEADALSSRLIELANGDPLFEVQKFVTLFQWRGVTSEFEQWLDKLKPSPADKNKVLLLRRIIPQIRNDWARVVQMDQEQPYIDPYDLPHWKRDFQIVIDLVGANDLSAAKAQAGKLVPEFKKLLDGQPANSLLWGQTALLQAVLGDKQSALASAHQAAILLPESADTVDGPANSYIRAQVLAWTGDKEGAFAELARLLRTPYGANVFIVRIDPAWMPLRADPRYDELLNDPKNNAPLP